MLRFFLVSLLLLFVAEPDVLRTEYYVVDRVLSDSAYLEPLQEGERLLGAKKDLPPLEEGDVLAVSVWGHHQFHWRLAPAKYEQRRDEMEKLLKRLAQPSL